MVKRKSKRRDVRWQLIWIEDGFHQYRTFDSYEKAAALSRSLQARGLEVLALNQA